MTEREIASQVNVDQSTVSRYITALKKMSQQFIFDLAYYYKQSLDGIEEAIKEAWSLIRKMNHLVLCLIK
jgi:DNA-directed RNA polymerase specialized sigma54-like protein